MKRSAMTIFLATCLVAGPAMADHEGGNLLTRENTRGALAAAAGGITPNKIGDGDGEAAATAADAAGGFPLSRNIAHDHDRNAYAESRYTTGYSQTGSYRKYRHSGVSCCDHDTAHRHRIHPIHETFVAKYTSNVRAGPSTRYHAIDQVRNRERVWVIGKVDRRNWYKIRVGYSSGFIYAPLLRSEYHGHGGYHEKSNPEARKELLQKERELAKLERELARERLKRLEELHREERKRFEELERERIKRENELARERYKRYQESEREKPNRYTEPKRGADGYPETRDRGGWTREDELFL